MTITASKARPLLQAVEFGESVAEYDRHLSSYFVETSSFLDIVGDRTDLILGDKGSGKSAIFYHLANPQADIPQLHAVDIVPAFNVQGSIIFRRLSAHKLLPEDAFRFMWSTFIIGMMANHLVANYQEVVDTSQLSKLLEKADLKVDDASASGLWEKIESLLETITSRLETEGELQFGIPKLPIKARARARLNSKVSRPSTDSDEVDLEQVLYLCEDAYQLLDRQCWVLFDRLDEAFEQNRDLEKVALRGLLRAHIDIASFKLLLRTKLFLRNDVLDRVTQNAGFVNATHLRKQNIEWDAEAALDLIVRRIASSMHVTEYFQIHPEDLRDRITRETVCSYVLPEIISHDSLLEWIEANTVDARGSLNPRNIISLLSFARQRQLEVYDRDDPYYDTQAPLITPGAMYSGYKDLSDARLEDTILAEFPTLREFVEKIQNSTKGSRLTRHDLTELLNSGSQSAKYTATLGTLRDSGLVKIGSPDKIVIARLYRPALKMTKSRAEMSSAEQADLRELVDLAITGQGQAGLKLPPMDDLERKYVHIYVSSRYGNSFETYSVPTPRRGLKQIVIKKGS